MKMIRTSAWLLLAVVASSSAFAADVGDILFPVDLMYQARAELAYENLRRDLDVRDGPGNVSGELEADVFFARIHTSVGQYASLDFDLGALNPSGGSSTFYGGIGLRYLTYDSPLWRVTSFGQLHYAPNVDDGQIEYDLIEADAGVLVARKIRIDDRLQLMPYVGPVLSILRLDGDQDFDAREDNVLGAAAGIGLALPGNNSIRLEARYFDRFSVSAALGIAF